MAPFASCIISLVTSAFPKELPVPRYKRFFDINKHNIADLFLKPPLLWGSFSAETRACGNWCSFFNSLEVALARPYRFCPSQEWCLGVE